MSTIEDYLREAGFFGSKLREYRSLLHANRLSAEVLRKKDRQLARECLYDIGFTYGDANRLLVVIGGGRDEGGGEDCHTGARSFRSGTVRGANRGDGFENYNAFGIYGGDSYERDRPGSRRENRETLYHSDTRRNSDRGDDGPYPEDAANVHAGRDPRYGSGHDYFSHSRRLSTAGTIPREDRQRRSSEYEFSSDATLRKFASRYRRENQDITDREGRAQLFDYLKQLSMQGYFPILQQHGITTLEALRHSKVNDLERMHILKGHALYLKRVMYLDVHSSSDSDSDSDYESESDSRGSSSTHRRRNRHVAGDSSYRVLETEDDCDYFARDASGQHEQTMLTTQDYLHSTAGVSGLKKYLKSISMEHHLNHLTEHGFSTLELLSFATEEDLQRIGFLKGHSIITVRALDDFHASLYNGGLRREIHQGISMAMLKNAKTGNVDRTLTWLREVFEVVFSLTHGLDTNEKRKKWRKGLLKTDPRHVRNLSPNSAQVFLNAVLPMINWSCSWWYTHPDKVGNHGPEFAIPIYELTASERQVLFDTVKKQSHPDFTKSEHDKDERLRLWYAYVTERDTQRDSWARGEIRPDHVYMMMHVHTVIEDDHNLGKKYLRITSANLRHSWSNEHDFDTARNISEKFDWSLNQEISGGPEYLKMLLQYTPYKDFPRYIFNGMQTTKTKFYDLEDKKRALEEKLEKENDQYKRNALETELKNNDDQITQHEQSIANMKNKDNKIVPHENWMKEMRKNIKYKEKPIHLKDFEELIIRAETILNSAMFQNKCKLSQILLWASKGADTDSTFVASRLAALSEHEVKNPHTVPLYNHLSGNDKIEKEQQRDKFKRQAKDALKQLASDGFLPVRWEKK